VTNYNEFAFRYSGGDFVEKIVVNVTTNQKRPFSIPIGKDDTLSLTLDNLRTLVYECQTAEALYFEQHPELAPAWDNAPIPFLPVMPPAVAEFVALPQDEVGQEFEKVDPMALGWFTEFGGKAHIVKVETIDALGEAWSLCGLRVLEGHPRREGEEPCGNCRTISLGAASHRETRPKVDGEFALSQDDCLERLAKHKWRWGIRSIAGDRAVTRRYCVSCGTYFAGGVQS
jgi:hypothetical protein